MKGRCFYARSPRARSPRAVSPRARGPDFRGNAPTLLPLHLVKILHLLLAILVQHEARALARAARCRCASCKLGALRLERHLVLRPGLRPGPLVRIGE